MDIGWMVVGIGLLLLGLFGMVAAALWFVGRAVWLLLRHSPAAQVAALEARLNHYRRRYADEENPITAEELAEMDAVYERLRLARGEKPTPTWEEVLGSIAATLGTTPERVIEALGPDKKEGG